MTRGATDRARDVRRLVSAGRALASAPGALVSELVASTGLSAAGVELALARHLETGATDEEIARLVARAGDAERVTVVLSANVFVGALRAIAIARAASERVVVKPSRRDPAFARALVEAAADPAIAIDERFEVPSQEGGEIHVYGRDETIARVRAAARPGVRVRGHGAGMGVAWISSRAEPKAAAEHLAADVVAFDQRGCLSPRVALVEGGDARAAAIAGALDEALAAQGARVPRGDVPAEDRAEIARYVATMTYAGRVLEGASHVIGVGASGAPLVLPPPYRTIHVAPATSAASAAELLSPFARAIVTVGGDDVDAARAIAPAWARLAPLGRMQRPPLDGPVDLRDDGA